MATLLFVGCQSVPELDPVWHGPFYTPRNHVGDPSLGGLRRVVLLPLHGGTLATPETLAAIDTSVAAALQAENRFEVVPLPRAELARKFRLPEISSAAALPRGFLTWLQEEYGAEAVLFVDLTVFSAYRPLSVGLRGKLAKVDGSRLIWSFDDVFSADDPAVVNSVRRYYFKGDRGKVPVDLSPGVLQSPTRFAGYTVAAMFATLPPVVIQP